MAQGLSIEQHTAMELELLIQNQAKDQDHLTVGGEFVIWLQTHHGAAFDDPSTPSEQLAGDSLFHTRPG